MSDPTAPVGAVETSQVTQGDVPPAAVEAAPAAKEAKPPKEKKVRVPKEPKVPRAALAHNNGITRPGKGTTLRVWEIADMLSKELGAPAPRKQVIDKGEAEGINPATLATQYGRWRRFYKIESEPKAEKAVAASTDTVVETPKV